MNQVMPASHRAWPGNSRHGFESQSGLVRLTEFESRHAGFTFRPGRQYPARIRSPKSAGAGPE